VEYFDSDEVMDRSYDAALMRRILGYLKPYRTPVALSIGLLLLVSVFQLAPPYLTKLAIDRYLTPASLELGARYSGLMKVAGVFALVLFLGFLTSYLQIYVMAFVGQRVMFDLRMQIFKHLQRMEVSFFDRNPVGRLMTRLTSDVEVLNEMFTSGVVAIFLDIFTLAGIMVVLCYLNLKLALLTFLIVPLLFLVKKVRTNLAGLFIVALLVNVGMWFERFNIIVTSLAQMLAEVMKVQKSAPTMMRKTPTIHCKLS